MHNTRVRLGDPRANKPGAPSLLHQVCSHTRTVLRQKRNTGNPWDFSDTFVDVVGNESTYLINEPSFGLPLAVLTRDESNPSHIVRAVPFFMPQNLGFDWGIPNDDGGSLHSAMRCSFFWKAGQAYVQFVPTPQMSCQYQIRFLTSANQVGEMALTQEPVPAEDSDLIEIRSALSLLALTEWEAPTSEGRQINAEKRKDLFVTLRGDQELAKEQFDAAQLITSGPRIHSLWSPSDLV